MELAAKRVAALEKDVRALRMRLQTARNREEEEGMRHPDETADTKRTKKDVALQNLDFAVFPPVAGMVLRTNATLSMPEVAQALGLPGPTVSRGTFLTGKAAEVFMRGRNVDKIFETRMVRYVHGGPHA
jgi:hypothetical protein